MSEKMANTIAHLGEDGLHAFYAWLITERLMFIAVIGLIVWGIRTVWKNIDKVNF